MSVARRRRLEHLQDLARRRSPANLYVDPLPVLIRLWAAFEAERAAEQARREFSRVPMRERTEPMSDEAVAALELAMREYDRMNARLTAKPTEVA